MLHRLERAYRGGNRFERQARQVRCSGRGHRVFGIMPAADRQLAERHQPVPVEPESAPSMDRPAEVPPGVGIEPDRGPRRDLRPRAAPRIVRIQHRPILLRLQTEQAAFGLRVGVHRVMPVHIFLREIQAHRNMRTKSLDRLQLETGEFQHVPLLRTRIGHHVNHRPPDIAAQ